MHICDIGITISGGIQTEKTWRTAQVEMMITRFCTILEGICAADSSRDVFFGASTGRRSDHLIELTSEYRVGVTRS
jgi:hypothetical protein